ncbi:YegP family protein [Pantoea sp. MBD-2R]|uniref:YegP family protein n=1 Tax=unclassified Pantoea TaxID=2630326 RepID=UPI0011BEA437|nr:YegP family protein [Pantoea sp. CCBC3-3-1]
MGHYEIRKSTKLTDQPWYFVLVASNHEIIATSEMYASKQGAENGIKSVRSNAPSQDVRDKT